MRLAGGDPVLVLLNIEKNALGDRDDHLESLMDGRGDRSESNSNLWSDKMAVAIMSLRLCEQDWRAMKEGRQQVMSVCKGKG